MNYIRKNCSRIIPKTFTFLCFFIYKNYLRLEYELSFGLNLCKLDLLYMKLIDLVEKHLFYFRTFIQQKFILINKLVDPRFDFSIDSLSQLPIFHIKCSSQ